MWRLGNEGILVLMPLIPILVTLKKTMDLIMIPDEDKGDEVFLKGEDNPVLETRADFPKEIAKFF